MNRRWIVQLTAPRVLGIASIYWIPDISLGHNLWHMPVAGAKDKTSGGEGWRSCPSASRLAPMAVLRQTTQRAGRFSFLCILHHPHPLVHTKRPLLPFESHPARSKSTQRTSISWRVQNDVSSWLVNADADYANRVTPPDVFQLQHLTSKRTL